MTINQYAPTSFFDLETLMKEISEFLARMAHDLRPYGHKELHDLTLKCLECWRRRQIGPGCRHLVTQRDIAGIVAGRGMAARDGGSVQSR